MWMLKDWEKEYRHLAFIWVLDESKHRLYDARKWLCLINILMRSTHMEVRPLTDTEHRNFKVKAHNRILDNQQIQSTSHVYYSILVKHTRERFLKKPWPECLRRYGCEPKMQRDFLCPAVQVYNVTDEIISPGRKLSDCAFWVYEVPTPISSFDCCHPSQHMSTFIRETQGERECESSAWLIAAPESAKSFQKKAKFNFWQTDEESLRYVMAGVESQVKSVLCFDACWDLLHTEQFMWPCNHVRTTRFIATYAHTT